MEKQRGVFNPKIFLSTEGEGRKMMLFRKEQPIFAQGDRSDAVFVVQAGLVRLSASVGMPPATTTGCEKATLKRIV